MLRQSLSPPELQSGQRRNPCDAIGSAQQHVSSKQSFSMNPSPSQVSQSSSSISYRTSGNMRSKTRLAIAPLSATPPRLPPSTCARIKFTLAQFLQVVRFGDQEDVRFVKHAVPLLAYRLCCILQTFRF